MKKLLIVLGVILALGLGYYLVIQKEDSAVKKADISERVEVDKEEEDEIKKASFAIFTKGTFRTFTADRYHNLSEEVYLTAQEPNTIYVTAGGITWKDFFESLPMKVTKDCLTTGTGQLFCSGGSGTLKFYLNGLRNDNVLDEVIGEGDRLLVSYGLESEEEIRAQMSLIPEPN